MTEESNGLEITTNDFLLIYQTPFARLFPIDGVGEIIMRYVCNLCYFLPYRPYRFSADFLNSPWLVLDYSIFFIVIHTYYLNISFWGTAWKFWSPNPLIPARPCFEILNPRVQVFEILYSPPYGPRPRPCAHFQLWIKIGCREGVRYNDRSSFLRITTLHVSICCSYVFKHALDSIYLTLRIKF